VILSNVKYFIFNRNTGKNKIIPIENEIEDDLTAPYLTTISLPIVIYEAHEATAKKSKISPNKFVVPDSLPYPCRLLYMKPMKQQQKKVKYHLINL